MQLLILLNNYFSALKQFHFLELVNAIENKRDTQLVPS